MYIQYYLTLTHFVNIVLGYCVKATGECVRLLPNFTRFYYKSSFDYENKKKMDKCLK